MELQRRGLLAGVLAIPAIVSAKSLMRTSSKHLITPDAIKTSEITVSPEKERIEVELLWQDGSKQTFTCEVNKDTKFRDYVPTRWNVSGDPPNSWTMLPAEALFKRVLTPA